jgi:hypothetical protein
LTLCRFGRFSITGEAMEKYQIWSKNSARSSPTAIRTSVSILMLASEIADQLILRALIQTARITIIKDASLLKDVGGVGSILRYNMNASASG